MAIEQTIPQIEGRMEELHGLMQRIHAHEEITDTDQARFDEYAEEFDGLTKALGEKRRSERLEKVARIEKAALSPDYQSTRGDAGLNPKSYQIDDDPIGEPDSTETRSWKGRNPWNLDEMRTFGRSKADRGEELRARALSAIEAMRGTNDDRRKTMTRFVEQFDTVDGKIAEQLLLTGSPEYMRAFAKLAKFGSSAQLSPEESRAMSLTDSAGGYLIPFQLDPTVINTTAGTYNEIRRAARTVIATGDVWNGVSAGATAWSWDAEGAEVSDDASTFAQPTVAIHKAQAFVPISIEAYEDEANVAAEVGALLAAGKENLEATAFATGSGSGEPFGIVTALTGGASVVSSATTDVFALADVYGLDEALPARHRFRASWLAHRGIYNDIRQFDTAGGAALWERLPGDVPNVLLGRNAYEAEAMDGTITALSDNYVLVFGDFSNYVIADRIGTRVELVPTLFHTTSNRPSGQRGWHAWYRVGADSVYDGAFRMLNVT